jgi:alkanesulfonate monooxygenase SsuD/methylene tetrahydromethanopterin reductase-like flavin-dependent oxidoreductase (luciferase family)
MSAQNVPLEIGIYLPQVSAPWELMLDRALRIEELGLDSLWVYDHLYAPGLPGLPSLEGWTLATALLARTSTLRVGHLVLCNNLRHPAVLAKMISSLDAISGGRFEVGIGSGSVEQEHAQAGLPWGSFAERSQRLAESLEVITRMLGQDTTSYEGRHVSVRDLPNLPRSPVRPPVIVGGAGERFTLPLVARFADVWNVPTYALDEIDTKLAALHRECEKIGRDPSTIRLSLEAVLGLAPTQRDLPAVQALAERRFGGPGFGLQAGGLVGTAPMVLERLGELVGKGFRHLVLFTHDRASDQTLELLAAEVLPQLRGQHAA